MVPTQHLLQFNQFNVTSFLDPQPHRLKRLIYDLSHYSWVAWVVKRLLVTLAASDTAYEAAQPWAVGMGLHKTKMPSLTKRNTIPWS